MSDDVTIKIYPKCTGIPRGSERQGINVISLECKGLSYSQMMRLQDHLGVTSNMHGDGTIDCHVRTDEAIHQLVEKLPSFRKEGAGID